MAIKKSKTAKGKAEKRTLKKKLRVKTTNPTSTSSSPTTTNPVENPRPAPRTGPRPTRGAVSPSQWEEIKWRWIKDGVKFSVLAAEYGTTKGAVSKHSCVEKWGEQREEFWDEARLKIKSKIIGMFARASLPPKRLVELIAQGAIRTLKWQNIKTDPVTWTRTTRSGREVEGKPFVLEKTVQVIDNENTRLYRELAVRMMNLFPAPQPIEKPATEEKDIPVRLTAFKRKGDV